MNGFFLFCIVDVTQSTIQFIRYIYLVGIHFGANTYLNNHFPLGEQRQGICSLLKMTKRTFQWFRWKPKKNCHLLGDQRYMRFSHKNGNTRVIVSCLEFRDRFVRESVVGILQRKKKLANICPVYSFRVTYSDIHKVIVSWPEICVRCSCSSSENCASK